MSYFNNDHLQINNIIIDFEENISKISSFNQILNSIDNMDEFIDLRNQLHNLFTDMENDTSTLINTLKIIQYNIRKLYDDFSLLQNNYEDIEEKLKMIVNDNSSLINKNKEINEQIKTKNQIIMGQENYINKLIEIIKNNENIIKEKNIQNKNKNIQNKNRTIQNEYDIYKKVINNNEKTTEKKPINIKINNIKNNTSKKSSTNHFHNDLRKNNSVNYKKTENTNISNNNNIKELNTIENYSKRNYEITSNNTNTNKNISFNNKNITNSINTGNYIFNDDFEPDEDKNNKNKKYNINDSKNKIEKVEKIISIIYNNNDLYSKLKVKYGDNLDSKIINENVSSEFLEQILKDIYEFSKEKENNNKNSQLSDSKGKNNINELILKSGTADKYKRNLDYNNNFFKNDENGLKLTNYFLFNLHREKMIDSQQRRDYKRPKTPKI